MLRSLVLRITNVNQPVVTTPAVRVDSRLEGDPTANDGLQRGFRAVRDDLRIDLAIALEESEDRSLTPRPRLPRTRRAPK